MSAPSQAQDLRRRGLLSFIAHQWNPSCVVIYFWVGVALAVTGGSFPLLGSDGTRWVGYGALGFACFCMTIALALLLIRAIRESRS